MGEARQELSGEALAGAIEANLYEQLRALAGFPGVEFHEEPDMTWVITGIPFPPFNGVFATRLAPGAADARIRITLPHFRQRKVPMIWWVGPSTQPEDLGVRLQAHGLVHVGDEPGMAVDLRALNEDLPPSVPLVIERVGDAEMLERWLHPVSVSYGFPESVTKAVFAGEAAVGFGEHLATQRYVASLRGEPVGASLLFMAAGVAGIYWVATVPDARRRGIGTAVTLAALREARARGYTTGVLHSTEKGVGVYRRLGFRQYCQIGHYAYVHGKVQRAMLRTHGWVEDTKARRSTDGQ